MYSQKAFLTRWMAAATKVAPFTYDAVMKVLKTSAVAAAQQCSGGTNGRMCGLSWSKRDKWDGTSGVGQQMAAMEVIQSLLIKKAIAPLTNNTGGTSKGDPNAGGRSVDPTVMTPATHPDKVGAGILTAVVCTAFTGMILWMTF
jgi:mannan endo-1,6-alpha-mannosidase